MARNSPIPGAPAGPVSQAQLDRMKQALAPVRQFLPQGWRWTHQSYIDYGQNFFLNKRTAVPTPLSTQMCRHTTLFLLELLGQAGDNSWRVAGGMLSPRDQSGAPGKGLQHWWLESADLILDLTADQAGWEDIVLVPRSDPRYAREDALSKKKFVSTLKKSVAQWRGEYASFWAEGAPAFIAMKSAYPALRDAFCADWRAANH